MVHVTPECFISYAPRGGGLLCAVVYMARGDDLCGWWIGRDEGGEYRPAYFLIERYYTSREGAFLATADGDVRGGWRIDHNAAVPVLQRPMEIDDALARELEQLQFAFAQEWLSFAEDDDAQAEAEAYGQAELATGEVAVRYHRLGKFDKTQPAWRHFSHGFDRNVLERLARSWPLFYRIASVAD